MIADSVSVCNPRTKIMKGFSEMENKLSIGSIITVGDMRFHDIEGGFGKDKRAMLVKEIAEIHGKTLYHINELINNNRKRFIDGKDILDLLGIGLNDTEIQAFGFTQQAINSYRGLKAKGKTAGIYILSERGYSKLLKIMDDDLAWEKYDQLVDGYFEMRKDAKEKPAPLIKVKEAEARLNNSRARKASMYMKIADAKVVPDKYKQVLLSYATKELNGGEAVLPLPPTQKGYSAQEIGDMFGLTANMVGRVANRNGLKKSEYGELREDKSKSSPKEVHTWVYFDSAIPAFEHVLGKKASSANF